MSLSGNQTVCVVGNASSFVEPVAVIVSLSSTIAAHGVVTGASASGASVSDASTGAFHCQRATTAEVNVIAAVTNGSHGSNDSTAMATPVPSSLTQKAVCVTIPSLQEICSVSLDASCLSRGEPAAGLWMKS